jgi:predicted kinase
MGIKLFHNRYRVTMMINGVMGQRYFNTEQEARDFQSKAQPRQINKSHNTSGEDLPAGWSEYIYKRPRESGGHTMQYTLSCAFLKDGKRVVLRSNYGARRTREETIKQLTQKMLNRLAEPTKK